MHPKAELLTPIELEPMTTFSQVTGSPFSKKLDVIPSALIAKLSLAYLARNVNTI
jgi:hypothetical protein